MLTPEFLTTSGNLQIDRRYDYACGLAEDGDYAAAVDLLEQTIEMAADWPVLSFTLGKYYKLLGRLDRAIEYLKKARTLDPDDHQGAALELERLGINAIQDNMPPAFVETLFNQYAERFDAHLVEILDYQVPQFISKQAKKIFGNSSAIPILDLGCGTGLAGEHLKPLASYMEGVDLSAGMLEQARQKNIYDELAQGELVEYLNGGNKRFPLIIAADVLIYFGALESVFEAIKLRLEDNGHFIFSVQALRYPSPDPSQPEYYLGKARRFSHAINYLENTINAAGLKLTVLQSEILRKDEGEDVRGYVVVCTK